jgi:hypothetical protein
MSGNWLHNVKHVTPGEAIEAGVVGRPDRTLEERTDYLKDRLDAAELGRALFEVDATVAPDVLPGQPVYWNYVSQRYERALAAVETDPESQTLVVQPTSDCVGMCFKKKAADRADIVIRGLVIFPNLDASIGQTVEPGRYFLSGVEAGKLVKQKPPVTVTVCHVQGPRDNCSDQLRVVVAPQFKDYIDDHTHYRFDLVPAPAGTHVVDELEGVQRHAITAPDENLPGWLPADHPIFAGRAPAGATFGYNISRHTALARVWPPIPIQSVAMLWDKGIDHVGATEIPLGADGLAVCDVNGIWWMSNCYGDVPWPVDYPVEPPQIGSDECPRDEAMRVVVVFLRMLLGNDRSVVTSLTHAVNSPIAVVNCDNVPATTGDLKLDLDLQEVDCPPLAPDDHELGNTHGGKVYTDIVAADSNVNINKNRLKKSWVTEGVIAHNLEQLQITGTWQRELTDEEKMYHGFVDTSGEPVTTTIYAQQGLLNVAFDNQFADREISPQIVRLNDAVERLYMDIPYLGLPSGQESSLRLRLNIPYVNLVATDSLRMLIRVQLFGRGGALSGAPTALPPLVMTHRILPAPGAGLIPLTPESEEAQLVFPSDGQLIALLRDQVTQKDSQPFSVHPGDTVLVTIQRQFSTADTYAEIGILRVSGIVFLAQPSG